MADDHDNSPAPPGPLWLTRAQAAERLQVSIATIDRGIASGELRHKRVGRTDTPRGVRIHRDVLDRWGGGTT